jgi:RimJ/RimL family protein N-acetyltransferase
VLNYAFDQLDLPEVVSFTPVQNTPSRRVMEKIGMTHDPADDFDHPKLDADSPLLRHVLYRLRAPQQVEPAETSPTPAP